MVPTETVATTLGPGTLNVQLNVPPLPTFNEPVVQLVIGMESKTRDLSVVEAVKPVPDTVTDEPNAPDVGFTLIASEPNLCVDEPVDWWSVGPVEGLKA